MSLRKEDAIPIRDEDRMAFSKIIDLTEAKKKTFQDCIDFANMNKLCYCATLEGDQPRVRAIYVWFADKTGFYFQTQTVKAFYKQLKKNNKVQIFFGGEPAPQLIEGDIILAPTLVMRVSGKMKLVEDDMALRAKCLAERPILKELGIKDPADPLMGVLHLYTGEAFFWRRAYSNHEAELPRIKF